MQTTFCTHYKVLAVEEVCTGTDWPACSPDLSPNRECVKYFVFILSAMKLQVEVNLEITTFFFYLRFLTVPTFSDLGLY